MTTIALLMTELFLCFALFRLLFPARPALARWGFAMSGAIGSYRFAFCVERQQVWPGRS